MLKDFAERFFCSQNIITDSLKDQLPKHTWSLGLQRPNKTHMDDFVECTVLYYSLSKLPQQPGQCSYLAGYDLPCIPKGNDI